MSGSTRSRNTRATIRPVTSPPRSTPRSGRRDLGQGSRANIGRDVTLGSGVRGRDIKLVAWRCWMHRLDCTQRHAVVGGGVGGPGGGQGRLVRGNRPLRARRAGIVIDGSSDYRGSSETGGRPTPDAGRSALRRWWLRRRTTKCSSKWRHWRPVRAPAVHPAGDTSGARREPWGPGEPRLPENFALLR